MKLRILIEYYVKFRKHRLSTQEFPEGNSVRGLVVTNVYSRKT